MINLDGILPAGDPLSVPTAFRALESWVRPLVAYDPISLWENDTRALPGALGRYRRRIRDYARTELAAHVLEHDVDRHDDGTDAILAAAGRAGLLSDLLPWPLGSLPWTVAARPLGLVAAIKMEELCAVCGGLGLAIGANALGTLPLLLAGRPGIVRRKLLPALRKNRRGEPSLFAYAITEPGAGSDVEDGAGAAVCRPQTTARRTGGGWLLNGRKVFISGGDTAAAVTVFAALEGEGIESWTCFLVERSMKGYKPGRNELKMGQRASPATELFFDDVLVPDANVVGGLRRGWAINRGVLNYSRVPVGAIALGIARGAMEGAIEFVCRTKLGSRQLIQYQDVQLAIAQMMIDTSAMRAMVWQSASSWVPHQSRASMTKVFCADTAVRVCESAMELLGDHGFLRRNLVEKAYRDARLTQIYEGTNQINRLAVIEDQAEELRALMEEGR